MSSRLTVNLSRNGHLPIFPIKKRSLFLSFLVTKLSAFQTSFRPHQTKEFKIISKKFCLNFRCISFDSLFVVFSSLRMCCWGWWLSEVDSLYIMFLRDWFAFWFPTNSIFVECIYIKCLFDEKTPENTFIPAHNGVFESVISANRMRPIHEPWVECIAKSHNKSRHAKLVPFKVVHSRWIIETIRIN